MVRGARELISQGSTADLLIRTTHFGFETIGWPPMERLLAQRWFSRNLSRSGFEIRRYSFRDLDQPRWDFSLLLRNLFSGAYSVRDKPISTYNVFAGLCGSCHRFRIVDSARKAMIPNL